MWVAAAVFTLCQQLPSGGVRENEMREMLEKARSAADLKMAQDVERRTQREFEQRFNKLVMALQEFEAAYVPAAGQVWPTKQAAKLDAAMRELTNSPGWRKYSR